jgi:hypothetical protein
MAFDFSLGTRKELGAERVTTGNLGRDFTQNFTPMPIKRPDWGIVQQPRSLCNPFRNSSSLEDPLIRRLENYYTTNLIDIRSNAIVFRNSFTTLDSVRPFAGAIVRIHSRTAGSIFQPERRERPKRGANVGCPRQPRSFLAIDARAAERAVREFYRRIR